MMKRLSFLALLASAALVATVNVASAQTWSELQTSTDEALLVQAIEKPGDSPEDIHTKNVAVKRLAIYGTPKSIPALVAMLPNEKLNFNARFALEAMPFPEVDDALAKAAKELSGPQLVGVVDTIGVRAKPESVKLLKELLADAKEPVLQKAIYAALGMIATKDAGDALLDAAKSADKLEFLAARGLGDALLDVADATKDAAYYDAVIEGAFPKFEKDAAFYRAVILRSDVEKVVETIKGGDASASDAALKTVREFAPDASAKLAEALVKGLDSFPADRQQYVLRALGDLKADAAKDVAFPALKSAATSESLELQLAAIKALTKYADRLENVAFTQGADKFESAPLFDAKVALGVALQKAKPALFENPTAGALVDDLSEKDALVQLKIIELARVKSAAKTLVKIAETKTGALRDAALAALSEIVELDDLDLLVQALNGETDDQKVDWLLRAACTRLPREDCAAKVADIFEKADLEQKIKILPLLKQIGGAVALNAVANACNSGDTVDKATQILGEWNTPEDAEQVAAICLAIAQQATDAKYHSRGIRGYVRVARQFDLPVARKIEMCKIAFDAAKRAEDKALIFEVFKRNIVAENVAAALEYVKYPEYKDAACDAAVTVAEKIRVSQPAWNWNAKSGDDAKDAAAKILVDGMKKVVETASDQAIKDRAQKLL
ncbi:MAG: hypothetical protein IJU03_07325 [Thermoguttaceae bacterium]|nr:hypothetical protein [Thermoguttaceae bacterium]